MFKCNGNHETHILCLSKWCLGISIIHCTLSMAIHLDAVHSTQGTEYFGDEGLVPYTRRVVQSLKKLRSAISHIEVFFSYSVFFQGYCRIEHLSIMF